MTTPKTLLTAWGLRAKKSLGQHFLRDGRTAALIVDRAAPGPADTVVEIGAGLGALTLLLARRAGKVLAVEVDERMVTLLRNELLAAGVENVEQIRQNILRLDLSALQQDPGCPLIVVGNLPYNISSQVLVQLIQARHAVDRAVLMFQKELAERIVAPPGSRKYGRLTVMLAYCADVRHVTRVKAAAFYPVPQVDSDVVEVRFVRKWPCTAEEEAVLFQVIKAAFAQRRKTLKNALAGSPLVSGGGEAEMILRHAGIDPRRRAETLDVAEFLALTRALPSCRTEKTEAPRGS